MADFIERISFMVVTDIGSDADDTLAVVHIINVIKFLRCPTRIAFVLSMLNPHDKAIFLNHILRLLNVKSLDIEIDIYIAPGYNTLEEATAIHPNFPPRFGPVYDQLQGINRGEVDSSNVYPIEQLSQFTSKCADHSIHLLVLSPISMVNYIDFNKINHDTATMMGGVAERNGVKKIGYNIGVSPPSFVMLCEQTKGKLIMVTPTVCDATRLAVDFSKVKQLIRMDELGNFIFDSLMRWHLYITKSQTNFLEVHTPCISDLVTADVFLRQIFPDYTMILSELIRKAVENRDGDVGVLTLGVGVKTKSTPLKINMAYKGSYLDDSDGELFDAKQNGKVVNFCEAGLEFSSTVSQATYGTYLVASVFTH